MTESNRPIPLYLEPIMNAAPTPINVFIMPTSKNFDSATEYIVVYRDMDLAKKLEYNTPHAKK